MGSGVHVHVLAVCFNGCSPGYVTVCVLAHKYTCLVGWGHGVGCVCGEVHARTCGVWRGACVQACQCRPACLHYAL